MSKPHKNNPGVFPKLKLDQLKCYARDWVKGYSIIQIEQITLHLFDTMHEKSGISMHTEKGPVRKYALVFEFSGCTRINVKTDLATVPYDDECKVAIRKIKYADQFADQGNHWLFDRYFVDNVYKKTPSNDYFKNWKCILKRPREPLPMGILDDPHWILFQGELDHIPTEKKQRPNQIAKTECRKIAQKLWSEDPTTTIVDMIVSDEISNACLEIAKKTFTEKILREWVKDLCPDRSPGRRPGT